MERAQWRRFIVLAALLMSPGLHAQQKALNDVRAKIQTHITKEKSMPFEVRGPTRQPVQDVPFDIAVVATVKDEVLKDIIASLRYGTAGPGFTELDVWPGSIVFTLPLPDGVRQVGDTRFGVYATPAQRYLAWQTSFVVTRPGTYELSARPQLLSGNVPPQPVTVTTESHWPKDLTPALLWALLVIASAFLLVALPRYPILLLAGVLSILVWFCIPHELSWYLLIIVAILGAALLAVRKEKSLLNLVLGDFSIRYEFSLELPGIAANAEHRAVDEAAKPIPEEAGAEMPSPAPDPVVPDEVPTASSALASTVAEMVSGQVREYLKRANRHAIVAMERARWQLIVGGAAGLAAVVFLLRATVSVGPSITRARSSTDSLFPLIVAVLPCLLSFGCTLAAAAFLLRQYRVSLDDVRYYERSQRLRESQLSAIFAARSISNPEEIARKTVEVLGWSEAFGGRDRDASARESSVTETKDNNRGR